MAAFEITSSNGRLSLSGELRIADAAPIWRELRRDEQSISGPLTIDLAGARVVDGGILSLLFALRRELAARGIMSEITGASEHLRPLLHLYHVDDPAKVPREPPAAETPASRPLFDLAAIRFVGDIVRALGHAVRAPATVSWSSVPAHAERAGVDGVPIVLLLNFLVGLVMAYQSANQLRTYGANIYVADVVGISVTRELVPLMTAIIMAGRSGASFAAELGTMKVTEETDALRTLGFSPIGYLVLPRIAALTLVAPVLTIAGDVVACVGGAVTGNTTLDVSAGAYLAELRTAVMMGDVLSGLVKSVAFAIAIGFIGCQQGFATTGGAAGVGRRTTSTVVVSLFAVVIVDTILTLIIRTWWHA
jgi:phospholipid/cholesterol/gamma-HCH transport system permease protein